jgi:hypothetical protein
MNDFHDAFECPRCQIGLCHPEEATYLRLHRGQLLSVPGVPLYTCDVCAYQEYDRRAVMQVLSLLGGLRPEPGRDPRAVHRTATADAADTAAPAVPPKTSG